MVIPQESLSERILGHIVSVLVVEDGVERIGETLEATGSEITLEE